MLIQRPFGLLLYIRPCSSPSCGKISDHTYHACQLYLLLERALNKRSVTQTPYSYVQKQYPLDCSCKHFLDKSFFVFWGVFFFFYSRQLLVCLTTFVVAQAIQVLGQWESRMVAVTRGPNVVAYINNLLAQVLWAVDS